MAAGKNQYLIFHIAGILVFICLPVIFFAGGPDNASIVSLVTNKWFLFFILLYIAIFYCNAYWLFPQLYLQKKYLWYVAILIVLLLAVYLVQPFDHIIRLSPSPEQQPVGFSNNNPAATPKPKPAGNIPVDVVSLFLYFIAIGLSTLIPVVKQWQKTRHQYLTAQKDKASAELSFLKAQINPHFLFNTLNNLYSLSLTGSDKTPESILRLSNIMRYVTDEVQNDFVLLENEIECVNDFIELQKLRLNNKTTVIFTHNDAGTKLYIAPLILLPFVENVFKHGVSNNESSTITIKVAAKENEILFHSRNSIFNTAKNTSRQGTGIANVIKRLDNLYPGKHFLKIEDGGNVFEVHLIINT